MGVELRARSIAGGFRVFHSFSAAVLDQIMLSAANFVVGLLLIRNTSDADYGMYVLVQSAILLGITAQSSWLSGPLSILAPKRTFEVRREMIGAVEHAQRRFLRWATAAAVLIVVLAYVLHLLNPVSAAIVAAGVLAAWAALHREFGRRTLLIYSRAHTVLGLDAIYVVVFLGGTFVAVFALPHSVFWSIVAMSVAGWLGARAGRAAFGRDPGWIVGDATIYLKELRRLGFWIAGGAIAYWLFSQSYNYVLVTRLDLKAVADVNGSRLLAMPAMVLIIGLEGLLGPKAAGWLVTIGLRALLRRMLAVFVGITLLNGSYLFLVWIFRDWLTHDFLHKAIGDRDRLLVMWFCVALLGALRSVLQSVLLALESQKLMAAMTCVSAVVSLAVMWFGVTLWATTGVLAGLVSGETVLILGYVVMLRREWQRMPRLDPQEPA